jgi:hypothetical protein
MTTSPTLDSPRAPEQHPERASGVRRHHWWRWVAGVLAVLLVLFVAAGWYFSGRIESGALNAAPSSAMPAYNDVRIQSVDGGSVTLAKGPDAPYNFDAAATYTIAWDGGWGRVGPATKNADGTVTRSLTVVKGTPPTAGQLAAQDRAAWLGDPSLGFKDTSGRPLLVDEVMVGDNPAWFFPAADQSTDTMAIVVHGQNGNRNNMLRAVPQAHAAGLPVLDITYRNDLGAAPDPSGRLQYGQTEWRDLDAAVTWARSQGAKNVVLIGESMGGAVVAAFLEESDQADIVSKVVLDAPMLSLGETIRWNARDAMPVIGGAVPAPVIWAAEQITTLRDGINWSKVDYLDDTGWLRVPTLVMHGTADERVPVTVARSVKAAAPSLVTLEEFPGAQHTEAWNSDPGRYEQLLSNWLSASS